MDEYLLFYKRRLPLETKWSQKWDVFVSAYNSSARVSEVFDRVRAKAKWWLILPEYKYEASDLPAGNVCVGGAADESEIILDFVAGLGEGLASKRIAIDITGFLNHYVLVLLAVLQRAGVAHVDFLYGEPVRYLRSERTRFSDEAVLSVRQVAGYEGQHTREMGDDLLVLAVGYDSRLVAEVASSKEHAHKVQVFGLPSLRPDMYQESLLRSDMVSEALGPEASDPQRFRFAPAFDPFVTASLLSQLAREHRTQHVRSNIYLSPLSTKAQALGFGLFYIRECIGTATSIIYPICGSYVRETSEGLSGVWLYQVEFPPSTSTRRVQ